MATIDFSELTRMAEAAGFSTEKLESGEYTAEVKAANYVTKSNGKSQFGFMFSVVSGPAQGGSIWKNISVPDPSTQPDPEKLARAASFFIRDLNALGVRQDLAGTNPDAAAKEIIGRQFNIKVSRTRPKGNGEFWEDVDVRGAATSEQQQQQIPGFASGVAPATPAWQSRPV